MSTHPEPEPDSDSEDFDEFLEWTEEEEEEFLAIVGKLAPNSEE